MLSIPAMISRNNWLSYGNLCLGHLKPTRLIVPLNPAQKAVHLLSCIENYFFMQCAVGNMANRTCLQAHLFNRFRFSKGNPELDSRVVWRRCGRQVTADFTKREKPSPDFCSGEVERAKAIADCVLRETGYVSGNVLNLTAVTASIERQDGWVDDPVRRLEISMLNGCRYRGRAPSMDYFLRCYVSWTFTTNMDKINNELAMALPQPAPVWP